MRNHYARLLRWTDAGEEVAIRRRGKIVARLVPASAQKASRVDWSASAALSMDKSALPCLSAADSARLLAESQGSV